MCVDKIKTMYERSRVASVFSLMYVALVMRVQVLGNWKRISLIFSLSFATVSLKQKSPELWFALSAKFHFIFLRS